MTSTTMCELHPKSPARDDGCSTCRFNTPLKGQRGTLVNGTDKNLTLEAIIRYAASWRE